MKIASSAKIEVTTKLSRSVIKFSLALLLWHRALFLAGRLTVIFIDNIAFSFNSHDHFVFSTFIQLMHIS